MINVVNGNMESRTAVFRPILSRAILIDGNTKTGTAKMIRDKSIKLRPAKRTSIGDRIMGCMKISADITLPYRPNKQQVIIQIGLNNMTAVV